MKRIRWYVCFFLLLMGLCGCSAKEENMVITSESTDYETPCKKALYGLLPGYIPKEFDQSYYSYLQAGCVIECNEVQASLFQAQDPQIKWYPQYAATIVIAIDREQTKEQITSWQDLKQTKSQVGIYDDTQFVRCVLTAISEALGEPYNLSAAGDFLADMQENERLREADEFDTPIWICFDYQAAMLKKEGKSVEIIVPEDGTITIEKGFVSKQDLTFPKDRIERLTKEGFRVFDPQNQKTEHDTCIYAGVSYEKAHRIENYSEYAEKTQRYKSIYRRGVMKERLLSSAEAIEDQMFAAILLLVLIFWIGSCIRRIMEKEIRYMMLGIGICLMLWIILRFVKYQMLEMSIWKRYCWYLYYVAQLAIPALLYELAKATDKNKKQYLLSRNKMLAFYLISVILVITNDWHRLVFGFEADFYQWDYIHTYEPLYYIIVGISYLEIFFSFANIIRRVYLSNSRRIILYMSILMAVGCSYFLSYIAGIKIIKSTDFVMLASCICMLYCELLLRSWVIPLNSRHKDAIENSNLEIAILDRNGSIYCQSEGAVRFNQSLWEELLTAKDGYIQYLQTIRLHMKAITGGYVVWKEDISELERLQQEITLHVEALKTSTQLLEKKQMMEKARHMLESKQYLLEILGRETKEILLRIREKIAFARTPYPMTLFHLSRLAEVR